MAAQELMERAGIVGESRALLDAIARIVAFAESPSPLLILGEPGTGKESAALAAHLASKRGGKLVVANAGGLSDELIRSELFGHEKGSFTGAHQKKLGRVREAEGGTVFLDEIGDMALEAQPHLLRFIQSKEASPVGGAPFTADVRIIAATNRDLDALVAAGRFRADLRDRLKRLVVTLPPLRERAGDVRRLTPVMLARLSSGLTIDSDAVDALAARTWPGNVRELEGVLEEAVLVARPRTRLTAGDFGVSATCGHFADATRTAVPDVGQRWDSRGTAFTAITEAADGWSARDLASASGLTKSTVHRALKTGGPLARALSDAESLASALGLRIRVEPAPTQERGEA